jgi:CBS domain-containing protein
MRRAAGQSNLVFDYGLALWKEAVMNTLSTMEKAYPDTLGDVGGKRHIPGFSPQDTVHKIIDRLYARRCSAGAVFDSSSRFIGLITEKEIVRRIFGRYCPENRLDYIHGHRAFSNMTAWDVMILNPDTLHTGDTVEDACDLITYFGYQYMPVIERPGKLAGIVSSDELRRIVESKSRAIRKTGARMPTYAIHQELKKFGSGFAGPCLSEAC